nr:hypothetical protein Hi04_10k_c377_00007 [uncultured bacterium]
MSARRQIPLQIPEKVRRNAALIGDVGHTWLADLPQRIAALERRWAITVGQPVPRASEAFVAQARTRDGRDAMLKIVMPGIDPARHELRILQAAAGVGYARLLCADAAENAMLLEQLGPPLHQLHLREDREIQIIGATLREAWTLPAAGLALPTGADKAVELSHIIEAHWASLGRPCSERTFARALRYAEKRRRAFDPTLSVLAHGDAHASNTLSAPGTVTGFKFVDPDGAFAERAFDLAIYLREWGAALPAGDLVELGRRRCHLLGRGADVACQPVWEWGLIQCVANGLLLLRIGITKPALVSLAMADAWAAGGAASR